MTLSDTQAAAAHLGLTVDTIRSHAKAGIIPAIKVGSRWRFDLDAIDAALSAPPVDPWVQSPQSRGRKRK